MTKIGKRGAVGAASVFETQAVAQTTNGRRKITKSGRVMMPFYVPQAARLQLRTMAVEDDATQQELLRDALNDYFQKRGKPPIA